MTKQTPHSILVEKKRLEAQTSRTPVLRLANAAMIASRPMKPTDPAKRAAWDREKGDGEALRRKALVVSAKNGKLVAFDGMGSAQTISSGFISNHIEKAGGFVMAVDKQSLDALFRRLERLGDPRAKMLSYQLRALSRLPASSGLGVLTALCNRKFWAPAKMDVGSIAAWRDTLGVSGGAKGYLEMIEMVGEASISASVKAPPILDTAATALRRSSDELYKMAGSASDSAAINSFLAAEKVNEAWTALRTYDPIARHEVATEGVSAIIEPFARDPQTAHILATVSQPCRIKTGRTVQLLSVTEAHKEGCAELVKLSFDPVRGLIGEFRPASVGPEGKVLTKQFAALDSSLVRPRPFVIATEPYFGTPAKTSSSSVWRAARDAELPPVNGRNVPVDVAFAGGVA